jgi:hypothetical protein
MRRFNCRKQPPIPLRDGVYAAQVVGAQPAVSQRSGASMIKLRLALLPFGKYQPGYLTHYLVFSEKGDWTVGEFLASAGAGLSPGDSVSLVPAYCFHHVIYPVIEINPTLKVQHLLTRERAIAKNRDISLVRLPSNLPPSTALVVNTRPPS